MNTDSQTPSTLSTATNTRDGDGNDGRSSTIDIDVVEERCAMTTNALISSMSLARSNNTNTLILPPTEPTSSNSMNIITDTLIDATNEALNNNNNNDADETISISSSGGSTDGGDVADGWDPDNERYDEADLDTEVRYMDSDDDVDTLDPLDNRHHSTDRKSVV